MSTVELTRETDGPGLIESLAAHGLHGELAGGGDRLVVQVDDCPDAVLGHAIEDWIRARDLPLVPVRLGRSSFTLSPPAG
jgi:hypothetical protein